MRYVITDQSGGIQIMQLADGADLRTAIHKWEELHGESISVVPIEDDAIPSDRTFRDAWTHDGKKISIDMPKAREIWRNRLREAREPLLRALDVEQLRGRNVEAEKQRLRDITRLPAIESAETPDDLKKIWL